MIYQFSVFFLNLNDGTNENPFWASCGKIRPLVLNYPVTFCQDRPAAARRCACSASFDMRQPYTLTSSLEVGVPCVKKMFEMLKNGQ